MLARPIVHIAVAIAIALAPAAVTAAGPRVLPEGKQPNDVRLQPPKDLNGYFPMVLPKSAEEWSKRAERIRRQVFVSQGLWPLPERTPLNAVIHGLIDKGDYTVEKVYFESLPGFYVTGNLYRPKNKSGKVPGVLSPHGHWADGRFHDAGRTNTRKELVKGAERFEDGGRSPLQSRQAQLARMGCVAFHYDMIGYADSVQLSYELAHRFREQRPEMNSAENWGLFSPQAEAHLQSIMGLQTWNSIRALDFLLSLPDIDPSRIAVSGASGGGTQSFLLAAVDPRVTVACPAVMVSTAMQGGCTCENSSCLRVGTGNIELAGLFAPKPLGMTAANDWTKEMQTKGFPELKQLYELLGAPKNVELFAYTHFGHNYNYVSRSSFYSFLNKHFKLGLEEPVVEEDYKRLSLGELTVWDAQHPRPEGGVEFERNLCRHLRDRAQQQLAAIQPKDASSLSKWREVVGGGIDALVGRSLPAAGDVELERTEEAASDGFVCIAGILRNKPHGEELPLAFLHPKDWNGRVVIYLSEKGKSALFADDGSPAADVKRLVEAGISVVGVDLLFQGEFVAGSEPTSKNRTVKNPREFAGYTYGYNYPLLAQRAHDVLSVISFVKHNEQSPKTIELIALDGMAPVAAASLAQCSGSVNRAAIATRGFRFGKLTDYLDVNFLPGGAKYGDLPGFLSLAAPTKLWLAGETEESAALIRASHAASGSSNGLTVHAGTPETAASAAVEWVLKAP